jgi:4-hydroxybenzoate polyprenyltransferase
VAALLVSLFAVSMNAIIEGRFSLNHALLLSAASIATATSSCFVLGELYFIIALVYYTSLLLKES